MSVAANRVVVEGRVQGVGFRWATLSEAQRLGLAGWVRNRTDGSVEALIQGDPGVVAQMLEWLGTGPPFSDVIECRVLPAEADAELESFGIRG